MKHKSFTHFCMMVTRIKSVNLLVADDLRSLVAKRFKTSVLDYRIMLYFTVARMNLVLSANIKCHSKD